ncbi:MuT/nudix family protein [Entamoeba marina]
MSSPNFYINKKDTLYEGNYITLEMIDYHTPQGNLKWESATSKTKKLSGLDVDAVELVPIVHYPVSKKPSSLVFISEFRVPVGCKVWQLAAGLVDPNETIENSAIRELKEETGYIAEKILRITEKIAAAPALSDTNVKYVSMLINGDAEENINPVQELEQSENIQVHVVPLNEVESFLTKKSEAGGIIEARLFCFACSTYIMNFEE